MQGEEPNGRRWHDWIDTGEIIQLCVMLFFVGVTYQRMSSKQEETDKKVDAQSVIITQMHESLDQLRTQRSMTPEAAQRIAVIETRMTDMEARTSNTDGRLQRIEDKIDDMRKELRK
jgi:septal ring factor EnvC (AmiA/AmiB activator)